MKGALKVTKEQVLEVERYCDEHGVTRSQRINELGISRSAYYYTHGLLSEEDLHGGRFMQLPTSGAGTSTPGRFGKRSFRNAAAEPMTIELRLSSGTEMRMIGSFSAEMLREIVANV